MKVHQELEQNRNDKKAHKVSFLNAMLVHLELIMAISSGVIILVTWLFASYLPASLWVLLHVVAFFIGGYHQGKEGILDTIQHKKLNVELLMVIAAIGAAAIGYWTEGAILIFIFAFAGALETYTLRKSENELSALMNMQPEEAQIVVRNGLIRKRPIEQVMVSDIVYVRAGERIPIDGIISKGHTTVDESSITGESLPVEKNLHQEVFAGTVALDGSIYIQVTKQASESLFQKIIDMVQTAKEEKTPAQLFIEKFEGTYVWIVLITVAIMMFLPSLLLDWTLQESIYRAMILLVVASPCALVASITPAALSAISNSAKNGVLFKGAVHMEIMSKLSIIAFDKTGTITNGTPVVTDFHAHPAYEERLIYQISQAIEQESTHPLASAITSYCREKLGDSSKNNPTVTNVKTMSGKGIGGIVNGESWNLGKEYLSNETDSHYFKDVTSMLTAEGKTVVYVGHENQIVAVFALKDTVRSEAKAAISALDKHKIATVMLTGDNESTARSVAKEVGITELVAECLPDAKVAKLKDFLNEEKNVAMVGDGINDAPALATADIGISMGAGTDVALETSDMVLMKNDLNAIPEVITLSKKMNRIIKQNIFFSLSVIVLLILTNFLGVIDLPFGVIGHEGSTILVILNGLRMLR